MPPRTAIYTDKGVEFAEDFNSWTLWLPKLHEHDLLVRVVNNDRFEITNIAESNWRTQPLRQSFKLLCLQPGDRRQLISDDAIVTALTHSGDAYEKPGIWG